MRSKFDQCFGGVSPNVPRLWAQFTYFPVSLAGPERSNQRVDTIGPHAADGAQGWLTFAGNLIHAASPIGQRFSADERFIARRAHPGLNAAQQPASVNHRFNPYEPNQKPAD